MDQCFKLICLAGFVVGPYYTWQGPCKAATRGEEQVSPDRPGKVFFFILLFIGSLHMCPELSFSWQYYAISQFRVAVCAGRRFSLFCTGMLCPMLAPWSEIGWRSRSSHCLTPIPLERKAYWSGKKPLINPFLTRHPQLVARRAQVWFIVSADSSIWNILDIRSSAEALNIRGQIGVIDDDYFYSPMLDWAGTHIHRW